MPIAFTEEHGSPTESKEDGVFEATRVLRCVWEDRLTLMAEKTNESYPYDTAQFATALGFGIEPAPGKSAIGVNGSKIITYEHALVTIVYRSPSSDTGELIGSYVTTERLEPTTTMISLPHKFFQWGLTGDTLEESEAPARQAHGMDYIVSHLNVNPTIGPYTIFDSVVLLVGKVNNANVAMRFLPYTIGTEKMLCLNPLVTRNGVGLFDYTYAFSIFQEGWNKFWRAKTLAYEQIYVKGSPATLYRNFPLGNFSPLFA